MYIDVFILEIELLSNSYEIQIATLKYTLEMPFSHQEWYILEDHSHMDGQ